MTSAPERRAIEAAYIEACRLDVAALKPGNVHVFADGHRMTAADFIKSAEVSVPFIADPGLTIGQRVRRGVEATFAATGCNTNLGILLLAAPIARAAEELTGASGSLSRNRNAEAHRPAADAAAVQLREALLGVVDRSDHADSTDVYAAIARANPAGIGSADTADVHSAPPPGLTLKEAMAMAAGHDLIAREYAAGFGLVFGVCREAYLPSLEQGLPPETAVSHVFMHLLATQPDTHIARKHGSEAAEHVCLRAAEVLSGLRFCTAWDWNMPEVQERLLAFDRELKAAGYNPGSLADILVAIAFVAGLARRMAAQAAN